MLHVAHGVGESTLISAILVDLLQIFDAPTSLIHGLVNTIASLKSLATRETVKLVTVIIFSLIQSFLLARFCFFMDKIFSKALDLVSSKARFTNIKNPTSYLDLSVS